MTTLILSVLMGLTPQNGLLGLRIGAEEAEVRAKLSKLGDAGREDKDEREADEEGESVVWNLRSGDYKTVVARFKRDRLTSLTAFVRPGSSLPFESFGEKSSAIQFGANSAAWNIDAKPHPYRLVAKGPNGKANVVYMLALARER